MYLVQALTTEIEANILGHKTDIKLSFAQGMIGALPVFKTLEDAEVYSEGKFPIVEIEIKNVL